MWSDNKLNSAGLWIAFVHWRHPEGLGTERRCNQKLYFCSFEEFHLLELPLVHLQSSLRTYCNISSGFFFYQATRLLGFVGWGFYLFGCLFNYWGVVLFGFFFCWFLGFFIRRICNFKMRTLMWDWNFRVKAACNLSHSNNFHLRQWHDKKSIFSIGEREICFFFFMIWWWCGILSAPWAWHVYIYSLWNFWYFASLFTVL